MSLLFLVLIVILSGCTLLSVLIILWKAHRIHIMTYEIRDKVEHYGSTGLLQLFRQLQALPHLERELGLAEPLPPLRGWAASPDFLLLLARHLRSAKPETIVECGSGSTTVTIARCLQLNGRGHLFSLEADPEFADATQRQLVVHGLQNWVTLVVAPLTVMHINGRSRRWYDLQGLPTVGIDMLVVDGPPPVGELARYPAGPCLFPRLSATATVFLDDADRQDEQKCLKLWQDEFPYLLAIRHSCEKGCVSLSRSFEGTVSSDAG